ncbi:putative tRNA-splicing endonuclease subunit [Sphaerulina musiva]
MGLPTVPPQPPSPTSVLQSLLLSKPTSSQQTSSSSPTDSHHHHHHYYNLALQIAHNLHYQHLWTDIYLHHNTPSLREKNCRPILSGLPPRRIYVHPDEQIALLQEKKKKEQKDEEGKNGGGGDSGMMPEIAREREWVLPSQVREKWSLRRLGEVFDSIERVPSSSSRVGPQGVVVNQWRENSPKRLLLATLDDDSTVVYYIVHDGIVKPRQN